MKQGQDSPLNPLVPPEIIKVEEYLMMLRLIDKGLWRTVNLAKALNVDDETIAIWKKTEPVRKLYAATVLKFINRRKDEEKILNELEVETPQDSPKTLVQINYTPIFGGKSVDALSADSSNPQDIQPEKEN